MRREPDFALIHKNYRSWWVVEVELGHHSFDGHVLPQVRTLARAKYGPTEADYLCSRNPGLDRDKIIEMFKGSHPRVLVVVNVPVDGWAEQLRAFGAKVVICQIFRSRLNRYVLRLNGEYPSENEEIITTCECDQLLHRLLAIHAPTQLPLQKNERVLLYHEGQASEWERIDTAGQVFLHALRDHNLEPGKRYEIIRQGDGTLVIRLGNEPEIVKREKQCQCSSSSVQTQSHHIDGWPILRGTRWPSLSTTRHNHTSTTRPPSMRRCRTKRTKVLTVSIVYDKENDHLRVADNAMGMSLSRVGKVPPRRASAR